MTPAQAIAAILAKRAPDQTMCPSEAARLVAGDEWRAALPDVHKAARELAGKGDVRLTWRGEPSSEGPYRIGRK